MPSDIHKAFVQAAIAGKGAPVPTLADQREQLEAMLYEPDLDAAIEECNVGTFKADWVRFTGCRQDHAILHLHGGGYTIGSRKSHRAFAARLSAVTQMSVLLPEYRLAPEHPFPAAVKDSLAALAWLAFLGLARQHTVLSGDSCGGGLVIATMLAAKAENLQLPAASVCLSPWVDLTMSGSSALPERMDDPVLDYFGLTTMATMYAPEQMDHPYASPLWGDLTGLPPTLIMAGTREVLLDDARRLVLKAKSCNFDVEYHEKEGLIHAWPVLVPSAPESAEAFAMVTKFIRKHVD